MKGVLFKLLYKCGVCFYITAVILKGSNYPAPLETASKVFTGVVLLIGAVLQVRRYRLRAWGRLGAFA